MFLHRHALLLDAEQHAALERLAKVTRTSKTALLREGLRLVADRAGGVILPSIEADDVTALLGNVLPFRGVR